MASLSKNILITGLPGSGKTTLIKKLADELREHDPAGFYTEDIRTQGIRKGFAMTSLDRKETGRLAHVDIKGRHRIGKYGVDLEGFEHFIERLPFFDPLPRLVIIDEIGRMECLSERFRNLVLSLLNGPAPVIATIAMKAGGFIDEVRQRGDVHHYEVTRRNRDALLPDIAGLVRSLSSSEFTLR